MSESSDHFTVTVLFEYNLALVVLWLLNLDGNIVFVDRLYLGLAGLAVPLLNLFNLLLS